MPPLLVMLSGGMSMPEEKRYCYGGKLMKNMSLQRQGKTGMAGRGVPSPSYLRLSRKFARDRGCNI